MSSFLCQWSSRLRRAQEATIVHVLHVSFHSVPASCQHSIHFHKDVHFLLKSKAVLPYLSSKQQGQKFIAKMLQQVSILHT